MHETARPATSPIARADIVARVLLSIGALAPYWPLLKLTVLFVTDGVFTSDLYNGELPGRVLVAQGLRAGHLPLWTSQMCSGYPLVGAPVDPLGLALFTQLPPAPALDLLLIVLLLVAAHGTYGLARRFGADRSAAVMAGIAFAGSGYIATQLAHLSIMSTIVWLPVGLSLIDRLFTADSAVSPKPSGEGGRRRALLLATLALLFANQMLAGFPQAAYICGLLYGSFALFRAFSTRHFRAVREWLPPLAGIAVALALGGVAGAIVLLPLAELASVSDRSGALDYQWATYTNFWPPNLLTFFVPYIAGDASDLSYVGPPPFWENYGYVGGLTAVLAICGAVRERRSPLGKFLIVMTVTAFFFILGPRTPVYYLAYLLIPGMARFRAPTRFLVVVELGLVLLAAIGLTRFREHLEGRWKGVSRIPRLIGIAACAITALDLFIHQPRQNAFVPASDWLAPPRTVDIVRADSAAPRTFTPHHRMVHRLAHQGPAQGWKDVQPYFKLRDLLEPDTGAGYWNVPSADCYVGLAPRWYVDVWSYHYLETALVHDMAYIPRAAQTLVIRHAFHNLLRTYGVTHVLSAVPGEDPGLTLMTREPNVWIYRVEGSARVRVVRAVRRMSDDKATAARLREKTFDPNREILLLDAPASLHPTVEEASGLASDASPGHATIVRETARELVVDAVAPQDGFLLLADMFYPGWHAEVDGVPTPIYRANLSNRGIALPRGQHTVRFSYEPESFFRGVWITLIALGVIFVWLGVAVYRHIATGTEIKASGS
jgi:hypothetical protein